MPSKNPFIYCALDTDDMARAQDLCTLLQPVNHHCGIKLGMQFFNTFGPQGVEELQKAAPDLSVFIDLKFYDIPNTCAQAVKTVSERLNPAYLNVHASGGADMMRKAKDMCADGTKLLAVTILTSFDEAAIIEAGYKGGISDRVTEMAKLAQDSGLDGVVCSAHEIELIKESCGSDFITMVPGIRPVGSDANDQNRIMTPAQAHDTGATHIVIGRPITGHDDPAASVRSIINDLNG
jgi:orotidine-5'-phosphate decarboxylase